MFVRATTFTKYLHAEKSSLDDHNKNKILLSLPSRVRNHARKIKNQDHKTLTFMVIYDQNLRAAPVALNALGPPTSQATPVVWGVKSFKMGSRGRLSGGGGIPRAQPHSQLTNERQSGRLSSGNA